MKPFSAIRALWLVVLGFFLASDASAQISFGPSGTALLTFDALPPVSEWSMRNTPGFPADIADQIQMDAQVQTNAASQINLPLVSASASPPAANANAMWASQGRFLTTRPTANRFTLMMATVRNDSGVEQGWLHLSYDLRFQAPTIEQLPGHSVYFSLTGTPGTWQILGTLLGTNDILTPKAATIAVGSWPTNALLYLLWTDDNGSGAPDTSLQIDNLLLTPAAPTISVQPQSSSVVPGGNVILTVSVNGVPPFSYQWMKEGTPLDGATNQTFSLSSVQQSDEGSYSVVVSNAFGTGTSSNAFITVACNSPVTFTAQPEDRVLSAGSALVLSVTATGTETITYQWHLNGVPIPAGTNQNYSVSNAMPHHSGNYWVVASNCAGARVSGVARVGVGDLPYAPVGLTNHVWRYDQSNVAPPANWRTAGFNDATWPQGVGLFAMEDNASIVPLINTVLSLSDGGGTRIPTYYFRTYFVLTNSPGDVSVASSNYFDDGVIVYLNGSEAFRYNLPQGAVSHGTLALAANPAGEGVFIVSNIPPGLLLQGTNVMAVEVHQNSLTSADIVFGIQLNVLSPPPSPLAFANQPADAISDEGKSVVFNAGVSGNAARFQWMKDGALIPGATALSLVISNLSVTDAGAYVLQASNAFGIVYSRIATLTVRLDRVPPVLVSADLIDPTHILASFSDAVENSTGGNAANYLLTNTFGSTATVFSALVTNQTNVLLTVSAISPQFNYVLTERGVTDASPAHNASPGSAVPVARQVPLIAFNDEWDFYDPYPPIESPDPGPNWRDDDYDTSMWGTGRGAFGFSQDVAFAPPVPMNTFLSMTPVHSSYFRAPFVLSASTAGVRLNVRYALDDGVVFYLNGQEVQRTNMPAGAVMPHTPAASAILNAQMFTNELPTQSLRTGQNLFAAEVHQWQTNDVDKFFGAELSARVESMFVGPLLVLGGPTDAVVNENSPTTLRVSAIAARLFQWQLNGTNLAGATNAALSVASVPLAWDGAQFRCLCSDSNSSLFSTSATLRVVADLTPPMLLSARVTSNNVIVVSFSETVAPASATNLANYLLTNSSGAAAVFSTAQLDNGTNVLLFLAAPFWGLQTLTVNNVTDAAALANPVVPGSAVTVGAEYFIPIDSMWKYLLINTNELVQSTFMLTNYDDSAWPEGSALFYVESAALPGPKNTEMSLFDATGVNRINTYYFRQRFFAAVGQTNATIRLRHVVDDGLVLHLNGQEILRYNMPVGTVTAASQALSTIGDATLVGPVAFPVAAFPGTNLFAAEVHQIGSMGLDVVFGAELSIHIPSLALPLPISAEARLNIASFGDRFALHWAVPGYTLECAENVHGPWTALGTNSPMFVPSTNAAAFYRLRE